LWGSIAQAWPKSEGLLFPGLTIVVLASIGIGRWNEEETGEIAEIAGKTFSQRSLRSLRLFLVVIAALIITLLLGYSIRLPGIKITSLSRVLGVCAIAGAIVLGVSRDARVNARRWLWSPARHVLRHHSVCLRHGSLGPEIHAMGRSVGTTNLYAAFYALVPGFDGVRVPARYATIVTLGLAGLVALGIAAIDPRHRTRVGLVAGALILIEALAVPMPINQNSTDYKQAGLTPLPPSVAIGAAAPEVYRFVSQLPASAVLLELAIR